MDFIKAEILKELNAGKIVEMDGPWCTLITIVKKKGGEFRKYVAYNGLNDRTERDSWPLPNIEELLECMAGHNQYTACDGFSGYYAVQIREEDIPKTVFQMPVGTYGSLVMPFGLKNAPHTYSRLMYKAYAHLIGKILEAYIDDCAAYSDTFEDHLEHVQQMFEAAYKAGIRFKVKKCHFFYPEIKFVGHVVGAFRIKMMPEKVKKVLLWPVPSNKTQLKGFLGLAGYYRWFLKDLSQVA